MPDSIFQLPFETTIGSRLAQMIHGLSMNYDTTESRIWPTDYVMVVGDTDSTLAGAIAAVKSGIPVAHVEAGLRCGDMKMQEEINRILVDSISTKHYATSDWALKNLKSEGHWRARNVGNVMVDTLMRFLPEAIKQYPRDDNYAVFTLHRAENVDDPEKLASIINAVEEVATRIPVIWPVHPRLGPLIAGRNITAVEPMGYLQFIALLSGAKFAMTDSGGVQEETTALNIPCLTLRENTERPETVHAGTNCIVGTSPKSILDMADWILSSKQTSFKRRQIDGWDGHAAERILEDLCGTL